MGEKVKEAFPVFSIQFDHVTPPRQFGMLPTPLSLSLPFHAISGGDCHMGDGYRVRRDGLDNYLLFLTLNGEGYLEQGGVRIPLGAGQAALIHCLPYQAYGTQAGKTWQFCYLHFHGLSMEGYRSVLSDTACSITLDQPHSILSQMERIFETMTNPDDTAGALQSHLISGILTDLVLARAEITRRQTAVLREDISALCGFIEAHYREDLHIEDFMRKTCLSRHYLIHLFEKEVGMSPYRYLQACRIRHAHSLLLSINLSVEEIAYRVGYHSSAIFIRHFKAFHTVTPHAYRQSTV